MSLCTSIFVLSILASLLQYCGFMVFWLLKIVLFCNYCCNLAFGPRMAISNKKSESESESFIMIFLFITGPKKLKYPEEEGETF